MTSNHKLNKGLINYDTLKKPLTIFLIVIFLGAAACYSGLIRAISGRMSSYALWYKGNLAYADNDFGGAGIYYCEALSKNKTAGFINYNLGNAYYSQGRYAEAIQAYKAALSVTNTQQQANAWNNLGNAYYMTGHLAESARAYGQALLLGGGDSTTRQNFVFVYSKLMQGNEQALAGQLLKKAKNNSGQPGKKDNKQEQKEEDNNSDKSGQKKELSEKTVEELLNQVGQNENKLRGRISKSKLKNDLSETGPDY